MTRDLKKWLADRQKVLDFAERVYVNSGCERLATVAECAEGLRMSIARVLNLAEDNQADGTMMVNTGIRCGAGTGALDCKGDYSLEAWTEQTDGAWRRAMCIPPEFDRGIADAFSA